MSYILDALKKSEQQRGDSIPSAITAPINPVTPGQRRFALPAILLTTALLAGWGIMQINRDAEHPASGSPSQSAVVPTIPPQPTMPPTAVAKSPASHNHPKQAALQPDSVPVFKPITPTSLVSRVAGPLPDVPIHNAQVAPAETNIIAIAELPLSVQQALPVIHIDGHIYDDHPAKRMVIINGTVYREKQHVAGGLILEEITPKGVILNFEGHVFHLGVFD